MTTLTTSLFSDVPDLEFFPDSHRYRYRGQWIKYSITQVISDKTDAQMARIMSTKHIWEPRGNTVHACLERFLLHGDPGDPGDYAEWIDPLVNHVMWTRWEPVAVEMRLVDPRHSICGSFDCMLRNKDDGRLVLADLKTLGNTHSKTRDISPQLGGYLNLADQCVPNFPVVSRCLGIWARPGSVELTTYETQDSITNYLAARSLFLEKQRELDSQLDF